MPGRSPHTATAALLSWTHAVARQVHLALVMFMAVEMAEQGMAVQAPCSSYIWELCALWEVEMH